MPKYSVEEISIQDVSSDLNTYYKAPKISPSIKKIDDYSLSIKTINDECIINRLEEVILMIIADFKFSPIWLVKQWFDSQSTVQGIADETIDNWIKTGMVWTECSATGVYLRPTRFLLESFHEEARDFIDNI